MQNIDISIVIATRNREQILWESVAQACNAIKDKPVEIIIVNDGDAPLVVPHTFINKVFCFDNPRKGVSAARNFGALQSKGSILFFIDDDMWINREVIDWIDSFVITNKKTDAVYNVDWEYPARLTEKLGKGKIGRYLLSAGYNTMWGRMHEGADKPKQGLYKYHSIGSCSFVVEKNLFTQVGMYSELIVFQGEDIELSARLSSFSIPIYAVFDTTLFHNHQDRLEVNGFLNRLRSGYSSEFKAVKAGLIMANSNQTYSGASKFLLEFLRLTEKAWLSFYKLMPNHHVFKPASNRLIGLLSGLERYKEWRNVFNKSNN